MELSEKIQKLEEEISGFKERYNSSADLSDTNSVSTIPKAEETQERLKELEDCLEEKYSKLKIMAIKLKKKVAEQQATIQKLESATETPQFRNIQAFQKENDRLQDEIDLLNDEKKKSEKNMQELNGKLEAQKIAHEKVQKESSEYHGQIQGLKKEKDTFNMIKQEMESQIKKLENEVKIKEKALTEEMEVQAKLRADLDKAKLAVKKTNVLSLEMDMYEKSLGELNNKLEAKKVQFAELEETLNAQNQTMNSLKDQIRVLEQSLDSEKNHSKEIKQQMDIQQNKLRQSEHEKSDLTIRHEILTKDHESLKLEMDEMKIDLTRTICEKEKHLTTLEEERGKLLKQNLYMENDLDKMRMTLKEYEKEIEDVKTEFAGYKIRAQSVLRQNQHKDDGMELESLKKDLQGLQKTIDGLNEKLIGLKKDKEVLQKSSRELMDDKERLQVRCKELLELLEESRLQNEQVLEESKKRYADHQESIKTYQSQVETLNNCYKKQIEEIEEKYNREILELQDKVGVGVAGEIQRNSPENPNPMEQKINMILLEREDGEGSENTSQSSFHLRRKVSSTSSRRRELMPLDELLNSSFDQETVPVMEEKSPALELEQTKEKLIKEINLNKHLSGLLSETEKDLAKFQQLNEMLKEEIRRHQRSVEREQHIQNSEYLKNVIIKVSFIQLSFINFLTPSVHFLSVYYS